jgi:hypothetical protein
MGEDLISIKPCYKIVSLRIKHYTLQTENVAMSRVECGSESTFLIKEHYLKNSRGTKIFQISSIAYFTHFWNEGTVRHEDCQAEHD